MSQALAFAVVTPVAEVLRTEAEQVSVPTAEGEITILPNHTQLLGQIASGILHAKLAGEAVAYFVDEGFVEAAADRVVILAERADLLSALDEKRARASLADAERRLTGLALDTEEHPIQERRRRRAQARLSAIAVRDGKK